MDSKRAARRRFLKEGAALAGLAVGVQSVSGQTMAMGSAGPGGIGSPAPGVGGYTRDLMLYGERSRFVSTVRTPMTMIGNMDMHSGANNLDAHTPLAEQMGIITPASLHYVSSHGNPPPDIDPMAHRLMINGMVDRPLVFTMAELRRLPAVSRIHYIECIANSPPNHDMIGCSEWTGVPLSLLLKEVGVKGTASWVIAQSAEDTKHSSSMPLGKAMDDTIVAYGQNGEPVRPHQGYPLRLIVPGFEGKYHVKWLKSLKLTDRPYQGYWESHHYQDSDPKSGYWMEQGPKSVIIFPSAIPSASQPLPGRGFYAIRGLAWSGYGAIRRVEVSIDNGRTWNDAQIDGPVHRMALTAFHFPWTWNGEETVLQSRSTDEKGQIQPTKAEYTKFWASSKALIQKNFIQPWRVTREGQVLNAL